MPIYEQTYRRFEGRSLHRFRWMVIVEQEIRLLIKQKVFMVLAFSALMVSILFFAVVILNDVIKQNPQKYQMIAMALSQATMVQVNAKLFYNFLLMQTPIVFLSCLYAGSGMICNDFRNNHMEVYFSKPISWVDYALGKILTLVFIGLAYMALPAILLTLIHNLMLPGKETFLESWWWPFAILGFTLTITLPCALGVLASSALLKSQNYAAIAIFMILIADSGMAGLLAETLRKSNYLVLSFPVAINRVGEQFFKVPRPTFDLPWGWSMLFVVLVCLLSTWIIAGRVRRAEIAA